MEFHLSTVQYQAFYFYRQDFSLATQHTFWGNLPEFQSTYRKGHSIETAVLNVFSDLVDGIEKVRVAVITRLIRGIRYRRRGIITVALNNVFPSTTQFNASFNRTSKIVRSPCTQHPSRLLLDVCTEYLNGQSSGRSCFFLQRWHRQTCNNFWVEPSLLCRFYLPSCMVSAAWTTEWTRKTGRR